MFESMEELEIPWLAQEHKLFEAADLKEFFDFRVILSLIILNSKAPSAPTVFQSIQQSKPL